MKMLNYHYLTSWSEEDKTFIGRCYEFPSLSAHGDNHDKAKAEILSVVSGAVMDLDESGEPIPEVSTESSGEIARKMQRFNKTPEEKKEESFAQIAKDCDDTAEELALPVVLALKKRTSLGVSMALIKLAAETMYHDDNNASDFASLSRVGFARVEQMHKEGRCKHE